MDENLQSSKSTHSPISASTNHGAHEILDVHEVLGGMIGGINQIVLFRDQVQDNELRSILDHQYAFMVDEYNIITESYNTGRDPSHPTKPYEMRLNHNVNYGLTPGKTIKPIKSANEINDSIIAGFILSAHKTGATSKTTAALETTNPVLRRILQASVANCIEMAYEISNYQNKKGNYEVPQLSPQDMATMLAKYQQEQNPNQMPN